MSPGGHATGLLGGDLWEKSGSWGECPLGRDGRDSGLGEGGFLVAGEAGPVEPNSKIGVKLVRWLGQGGRNISGVKALRTLVQFPGCHLRVEVEK